MVIVDIQSAEQFGNFIKSKKTLCLYYWNYCGHCHTYMPIWTRVVSQFKIPVAKIELSTMKKLPSQHAVSGFPIVVIYENGKKIKELPGSRNEKDLHKFIVDNFAEKKVVGKKEKPVQKLQPKPKKAVPATRKNMLKK